MIIAIIGALPYLAFLGAAVLVGFVAYDVIKEKRSRRALPAVAGTEDSGRGLVSAPEPIRGVVVERNEESVEDAREDLRIPHTQARDLEEEPVPGPEVEYNRPSDTERSEAVESKEVDPMDKEIVYTDALSVRRDPSVRVFDTAVAASERKPAPGE